MQMHLDSDALDEAVKCYLAGKLRDIDSYDLSIKVIAGRGGNGSQATVTFTTKGEQVELVPLPVKRKPVEQPVEEESKENIVLPSETPQLFGQH